jgi:hypothetical protein
MRIEIRCSRAPVRVVPFPLLPSISGPEVLLLSFGRPWQPRAHRPPVSGQYFSGTGTVVGSRWEYGTVRLLVSSDFILSTHALIPGPNRPPTRMRGCGDESTLHQPANIFNRSWVASQQASFPHSLRMSCIRRDLFPPGAEYSSYPS